VAGDWIKMEMELSDKPEVHYIANALNLDPDAVVGKLFRVWCWFNKHTVDGNANGVTFSLVDRITGVTGFGESMCFAGWLEQKDTTLHMPNFDYHTSESAKGRALTAKRVAKSKANKKSDGNGNGNGAGVTSALPREEKRREDINTKGKRSANAPPVIPEWVPRAEWSAWIEMRKKLRKPATDFAIALALRQLDKFRGEGHDLAVILSRSAFKGWTDLYAPNDSGNRIAVDA
jgi:hypothetical protein